MSVITFHNSYIFRAIWGWKISGFFLDFLEIQEITEILEILEIQAQIGIIVSRMMGIHKMWSSVGQNKATYVIIL